MRARELEFTVSEVAKMMGEKAVADGDLEAGEYNLSIRVSHEASDHDKSRLYLVIRPPKRI